MLEDWSLSVVNSVESENQLGDYILLLLLESKHQAYNMMITPGISILMRLLDSILIGIIKVCYVPRYIKLTSNNRFTPITTMGFNSVFCPA